MIKLSVENLCQGAIIERIHDELMRVIANIQDINTPAKKPRTVTLKLKVTPNELRNVASVSLSCSSTLQPAEEVETSISMGTDIRTGELYAEEIGANENAGQEILPGVHLPGKIANEQKSATVIGYNAVKEM